MGTLCAFHSILCELKTVIKKIKSALKQCSHHTYYPDNVMEASSLSQAVCLQSLQLTHKATSAQHISIVKVMGRWGCLEAYTCQQ